MKIYKCFCDYTTNSNVNWKNHREKCNMYQLFKSTYLNRFNMYYLYMIKRMTFKQIFSSYPYNMFCPYDIGIIKKSCNFPHLWPTNKRMLTRNEINNILTYNTLYDFYINKKLDVKEISKIINNNEFSTATILARMKELHIPIRNPHEISSSQKFLNNRQKTNLKLYGTINPITLSKFKNKRKNTWLSKWGADHPMKSSKGKQLQQNTIQRKYHGKSAFCDPEIYKKTRKTLHNKGYYQSHQSIKLFNAICEKFPIDISKHFRFAGHGEEVSVVHLNSHYNLDFSISINNIKIDIEYNGDYWHANPNKYQENDLLPYPTENLKYAKDIWKHDESRKIYLESQGYKILTIWESEFKNSQEDTISKCVNFIKSILNAE